MRRRLAVRVSRDGVDPASDGGRHGIVRFAGCSSSDRVRAPALSMRGCRMQRATSAGATVEMSARRWKRVCASTAHLYTIDIHVRDIRTKLDYRSGAREHTAPRARRVA